MLKRLHCRIDGEDEDQPPSGGCVLKPSALTADITHTTQPPSGGCVLKRIGPTYRSINLASRLRAAVC